MGEEVTIQIEDQLSDSGEVIPSFCPYLKVEPDRTIILNGEPVYQPDYLATLFCVPISECLVETSDGADQVSENVEVEMLLNEHNYHQNFSLTNDEPIDFGAHICPHCDKSFTTHGGLRRHLRSHTGERPYQCEVCEKKFSQQSNLWKHIRIHTGERPYECPQCRKRFTQRANMQKHMIVHSGERPFQCCYCNRAFTQQANLSKHVRLHTGEKPYDCKYCHKRFSQRSNMLKHQNLHEGMKPYNLAFSQESNLKKHILIHKNEKSYSCSLCEKSFTKKITLVKHMETCTSELPEPVEIFKANPSKTVHDCVEMCYYFNGENQLIKIEPRSEYSEDEG